MGKVKWQGKPEKVYLAGLKKYQSDWQKALELLCLEYAPKIEAWLKENARWTDRTGNLRQSMFAEVQKFVDKVVLMFDYGLEYGFWLETKNNSEFSVISPALDHFGQLIWEDIKRLMSK